MKKFVLIDNRTNTKISSFANLEEGIRAFIDFIATDADIWDKHWIDIDSMGYEWFSEYNCYDIDEVTLYQEEV